MKNSLYMILIIAFSVITFTTTYIECCNELVCASVVSKCMLTQSCKCDLKNCSCCKECLKCLDYLYTECCSCVDLCPKPNNTRTALSRKSHVEEFEGIPGLFSALTSEPDEDKWHIVTFPVDFDAYLTGPKIEKDVKYYMKSNEQEIDDVVKTLKERENTVTVNCTVVYLTQCLSWNKCRQNCESMGASSYRWFHDGCCECVGSTCINYGINESRCTNCPENKDDYNELDDADEDWQEFGESLSPFDANLETTNLK